MALCRNKPFRAPLNNLIEVTHGVPIGPRSPRLASRRGFGRSVATPPGVPLVRARYARGGLLNHSGGTDEHNGTAGR